MVWIEGEPEHALTEVWAYLSPAEARELLLALQYWAEDEDHLDPWHHHLGSNERELTIAIDLDGSEGRFANRPIKP